MANIREVLGTSIDLDDYSKKFPISYFEKRFPDAIFLGFGWRNISKETTADDDFNRGVRYGGTPNAEESLGADLSINGWKTQYLPPVEDENGLKIDGRTRIKEMRRLGEKYVPVAKLKMKKSKKPGTKKRSAAVLLNQHDYNKRTQMWDFVVAVCADIREGECRPDRDSIEAHLYTEYKIGKFYDSVGGGPITKIINQILKKMGGGVEVTQMDREEHMTWLRNQTHIMIPESTAIFKTGGSRPEQLLTRHILVQAGKKPDVVLYGDGQFAEDARESIIKFENDVKSLYKKCFKVVSSTAENLNITAPEGTPYNLLGIIPLIETEYQQEAYKEGRLLTKEEYLFN